jgi:sialic acid synthase SpsE
MQKLHEYCGQLGIEFMCSPFGVSELLFLKPLLKRVKIASGMSKRQPFMEEVSQSGLPVILSTGMSTVPEIHSAISVLTKNGHADGDITLLQCTSAYPCNLEDVHLSQIHYMRGEFHRHVGLSDHTSGITVPIAAAALGAVRVEKHFTQDRGQEGPDHKASITPKEFMAMRMAITEVEAAMGDGPKRVLECEKELRSKWSK